MPFLYFLQDEWMALVSDTEVLAKNGIIYLPPAIYNSNRSTPFSLRMILCPNTWLLPRLPTSVSATIGKHELKKSPISFIVHAFDEPLSGLNWSCPQNGLTQNSRTALNTLWRFEILSAELFSSRSLIATLRPNGRASPRWQIMVKVMSDIQRSSV
jgi:hypothetical protein